MLYTKSDKIQQYTLGRKGGSNTGNLADNLMEELNCEKVFTLPVLGGINESVVVTWIIRRNTGKRVGRSYLDHHGSACDSIHYPGKKLKG